MIHGNQHSDLIWSERAGTGRDDGKRQTQVPAERRLRASPNSRHAEIRAQSCPSFTLKKNEKPRVWLLLFFPSFIER